MEHKGIKDKLSRHSSVELGLLELSKNARIFIRQIQLIQDMELSGKELKTAAAIKHLVADALERRPL